MPQYDRPLSLWLIFPLIFAGVYLSHLSLLHLPYYWDEAGYYIPAAFDFFRTGSLVPTSTLSNAHPPLPSIYLALWWRFSGYSPFVTRTAMCVVAALALLAVYRLAMRLTGRGSVAAATVLLTGTYPIWFAQSTLAHADLFAAAATLWGLALAMDSSSELASEPAPAPAPESTSDLAPPERGFATHPWGAVVCFAVAALAKETAIVTPLALAGWEVWLALQLYLQNRGQLDPQSPRRHVRAAAALALTVVPLVLWYAYHYHRTGFIFGNPEFLRYNATSTLSGLRILLAFGHRVLHLVAHMNMFVPVAFTAAAMMLPPRDEEDGRPRPRIAPSAQARIYTVLLANTVFYSVMGGALLTRYLLPLYPLVLLICVNTLRRRAPLWPALVGLSAVAFVTGLFVNPLYGFAPEDNLAYRDVIVLHQQAIGQLTARYPNAVVLTAWPVSDELLKPELGYVARPFAIVRIENFSLEEIQKAAQSREPFTVALVFSTKYDPPHLPLSLGPRDQALNSRFFDFHKDMPPDAIADMLGGDRVWQAERKGQWVALLHFNRPQLAVLNGR